MTKILISNAYTWYNKGDAAILIGMFKAIRTYIPDAEITVLSFTPEIDQENYERYNVKVLSRLLGPSLVTKKRHKIFRIINIILKAVKYLLWPKLKIFIDQNEKEILKSYNETDLILACGGGFLGGYNMGSILHLYNIYFGKILKKPVIIYAQSVEPFGNALISTLTKFVLNRIDLITIREKQSFEYLKSLNIKPNIFLTADAAFLVDSIPLEESIKLLEKKGINRKKNKMLVGITVRKWNFSGHKNSNKKFLNYLNAISKAIEYVISSFDARVILFPQVIYAPYDDDRVISNLVKDRLKSSIKEYVTVLTEDYRVEEIKGMIGQMDLFIGTRMHSNIFATSMNVPTIAISYEQKTKGIMEMLDMGNYVVDINTITTYKIISVIDKAWKNKLKIKEVLKMKIEEIKNRALFTAELVNTIRISSANKPFDSTTF